jgi:hypothetical protein
MKTKFPFFGVLLIVVGCCMLLHRTGMLHFSWPLIFWIFVTVAGAFKLFRGFADPASRGQFWGTIFFGVGLAFVLGELDLFVIPGVLVAPSLLALIGAGFLVKFAAFPREWHLLIPGLLFAGLGSSLLLAELDYLPDWEIAPAVASYWPLALVVFGAALLLNRRSA